MVQQNTGIENFFKQVGNFIIKYRIFFLVLFIVLIALSGLGIPGIVSETSYESVFKKGSRLEKAKEEYSQIFGNYDFVAFYIEADDVFAKENIAMLRSLEQELLDKIPYAKSVVSLANLDITLSSDDNISTEPLYPQAVPERREEIEAIRKLAFSKTLYVNRLFSDDSRSCWLFLNLYPYSDEWKKSGEDDPRLVIGGKVIKLIEQEEFTDFDIRVIGKPVLEYEEDLYFSSEAFRLVGLAFLLAIVVLAVVLQSVRGVAVPMLTLVSSIVIVFGFMGHLKIPINQSLISVPIYLGLAVSIGYSIHVFNFYKRKMTESGKRKEAVVYAISQTGWPIFFTALTTIGSLLSFYFVGIKPVQWLGVTAAFVILSVYVIVMIMTPVLLSFGKDKKLKESAGKQGLKSDSAYEKMGKWILRRGRIVVLFFIVIIIILGIGLTRLQVNVDYKRTFGTKLAFIEKMEYIRQTKIGLMFDYNLVIKFKDAGAAREPEVLKACEKLIAGIEKNDIIKNTSSILDIVKEMNQLFNGGDESKYSIPDQKDYISQLLLVYEFSGGKQIDDYVNYDFNILRININLVDFDNNILVNLVSDLEELGAELFPEAEVVSIGSVVEFITLHDLISFGVIKSFLIALLVISVLMMIVFKSIRAGLIGIIPNIVPAFFIGGIMGLCKIPLDMMTMTVIPMVLGLSVDDTIHFIIHTKMQYRKTGDYDRSILITFKTVGRALFLTTLILCLSFSIYLTSDVNVLIFMGLFSIIGFVSALISDYLFCPLLIRGAKLFKEEGW